MSAINVDIGSGLMRCLKMLCRFALEFKKGFMKCAGEHFDFKI